MSEKDTLVSLNAAQTSPNEAKPSDFPSGGSGQMAEGKDQLCGQTANQRGPRQAQDSGDMTPSVWGKATHTVSTNKGESSSGLKSVSDPNSVDLVTGKLVVSGYGATKVGEVGDPKASIPSR